MCVLPLHQNGADSIFSFVFFSRRNTESVIQLKAGQDGSLWLTNSTILKIKTFKLPSKSPAVPFASDKESKTIYIDLQLLFLEVQLYSLEVVCGAQQN